MSVPDDVSGVVVARKKRKGRPLSECKRTVTVSVRLSVLEAVALDEARGHRQRGAFLRELFVGQVPRPVPSINLDAWQALSRAASNLNQLSRHLNSGGAATAQEALSVLEDFRDRLIGMRQS
jgi:hypothetical protein